MRRIGKSGRWLAACLGFATVLQAAPVIEAPTILPEAMLSITVSDLHGLIDEIGPVAVQVSPMMNGLMLKNLIGMQVGDPGLTGIEPGKGFSVVALDPTNVFAVIELTEVSAASFYTNFLAPKGLAAKYTESLLVVGQTAEQVTKGVDLAPAVQSLLLSTRTPSLQIALQPSAMVENNGDRIQRMMAMMPMMVGQSMMQQPGATLQSIESTTKILEGELRVLLSLAAQCESAEVILAPKNGSIRITKTFVPKIGSRLETLCNAPVVNPPNPKVKAGYLGAGAILFDSRMANPAALMDFVVAETELLFEAMEIADVDLSGITGYLKKWWAISGGGLCETVGSDGESGMSVGYLMDVTDEAEALSVVKSMPQDLDAFMGLYEEMGLAMTMDFKENVRGHNGTPIHQFVVNMSMTNQPPEVTAQLNAMNLTNMVYDIAIVDGMMIYAMGGTKVEAIIDRLADESFTPAPLKAYDIYPADGFYYFDLDLGEYMALSAEFSPVPGMAQMATLFQGAEPLTSAGFKADGRVMWSINIPSELIAKYGQMAMMIQMQQMR